MFVERRERRARAFTKNFSIMCGFLGFLFILTGLFNDTWLIESFDVAGTSRRGSVGRGFWSTTVDNNKGAELTMEGLTNGFYGSRVDPFCGNSNVDNPLITAFELLFPPGSVSDVICCNSTSVFLPTSRDSRHEWCHLQAAMRGFSVLTGIFAMFMFIATYTRSSTVPFIVTTLLTALFGLITSVIFAVPFFKIRDYLDDVPGIYANGTTSIGFFVAGWCLSFVAGANELFALCSPMPERPRGSRNPNAALHQQQQPPSYQTHANAQNSPYGQEKV